MSGRDQRGKNRGCVEGGADMLRGDGSVNWQPGETLTLRTEQVEELFGLNDGTYTQDRPTCPGTSPADNNTWQGRAQLTFHADGDITVVPQIQNTKGSRRDIGGFTGLNLGEGLISK